MELDEHTRAALGLGGVFSARRDDGYRVFRSAMATRRVHPAALAGEHVRAVAQRIPHGARCKILHRRKRGASHWECARLVGTDVHVVRAVLAASGVR
jgi:hypothetical protein